MKFGLGMYNDFLKLMQFTWLNIINFFFFCSSLKQDGNQTKYLNPFENITITFSLFFPLVAWNSNHVCLGKFWTLQICNSKQDWEENHKKLKPFLNFLQGVHIWTTLAWWSGVHANGFHSCKFAKPTFTFFFNLKID